MVAPTPQYTLQSYFHGWHHFRDRFLVATGEIPGNGDFAFAQAVEDASVALGELCGGEEAAKWVVKRRKTRAMKLPLQLNDLTNFVGLQTRV